MSLQLFKPLVAVIMEKLQKSQLAQIFLLFLFLFLLLLTPFISTSMRPSYLYFLLNLLIVALGIDAGFLAAISKPRDEKKSVAVVAPITIEALINSETGGEGSMQPVKSVEKPTTVVAAVEKKIDSGVAAKVQKLKRCPTRPSLFFIGSCEGEEYGVKEEEEEEEEEEKVVVVKKVVEEVGELSKQELFMKAETFIGNFYKQLKMQRENSWKKIHGIYHRAF